MTRRSWASCERRRLPGTTTMTDGEIACSRNACLPSSIRTPGTALRRRRARGSARRERSGWTAAIRWHSSIRRPRLVDPTRRPCRRGGRAAAWIDQRLRRGDQEESSAGRETQRPAPGRSQRTARSRYAGPTGTSCSTTTYCRSRRSAVQRRRDADAAAGAVFTTATSSISVAVAAQTPRASGVGCACRGLQGMRPLGLSSSGIRPLRVAGAAATRESPVAPLVSV